MNELYKDPVLPSHPPLRYCDIESILTRWGRVTHICVTKLGHHWFSWWLVTWQGSQVSIWTKAGILLIRTLGTNFSEISLEIHTFTFKKMHLKMSSGTWRPFCLGLNVLLKIWIVKYEWQRLRAVATVASEKGSYLHCSKFYCYGRSTHEIMTS